jgi:hypothetical protein
MLGHGSALQAAAPARIKSFWPFASVDIGCTATLDIATGFCAPLRAAGA